MIFYIDAQPFNLRLQARSMNHAMERINDFDIGRNLGMANKVFFSIDRISTKPSRKTTYVEI